MKRAEITHYIVSRFGWRSRVIALSVLIVIISGLVYGIIIRPEIIARRKSSAAKMRPAENIKTIIAAGKEINDTIQVLGQIVFKEKVNISSKVNGRLSRIYVKEGKKVSRGEIIAEIERLPFEITLKQQQSELEIAKKALELAEAKYNDALKGIEIKFKTIKKAKADLNDKRVSYENMNNILKNKTELFKAGGISNSELESIKTQHTTLLTKYELAKSDYEIQQVGYRDQDISAENIKIPSREEEKMKIFKAINTKIEKAEVESARSRVKQARSALLSTELLLRETYIKSPITGVVAVKNMEAGEMVKEDSVISTVMDISSVYISMNLNEKDITKIRHGQKVRFTVDALDKDREFAGLLDTLSPVLDARTRSAEVKGLVKNGGNTLLPGMFARAVIDTGRTVKGVLVPGSAILSREDGRKEIFLVKNGIAIRENIVTGNIYGDDIHVMEGVKEGDVVVVTGINSVYQGMKIGQ